MESTLVKISSIKLNPNNPRLIKDDKFLKLVESIKSFPEMLRIRPIVINSDNIILGGNMRLKACKEAGLKEVPIIKADELTEDQQKEFIIKDNVAFGEWDLDMISNDWNSNDLDDWGLDVPAFNETVKSNNEEINEYNKVHVLLSFHPDIFQKLEAFLEKVKNIDGVEYEQSAN